MNEPWWKDTVVYQIYPRSFQDSNGDGIGDLRGIIGRLDYIESLGVGAVWLGPVYTSPGCDFGYDVADFRSVSDLFGTMADFDALLNGLHERGIRLILDFVVNHTSVEHPWFRASRSSRDNPYRSYYYWREPGADGGPPNNWESFSGGSAWKCDGTTGDYYLHVFMEEQPDLDWANPSVRQEMYGHMRYWLDKGVDGFRLDAANMFAKPEGLPDDTSDEKPKGHLLYKNGPAIHDYYREMHDEVFARYPDAVFIGEAPTVTTAQVRDYTDPKRRELSMVLQMGTINLTLDRSRPWEAKPADLEEVKTLLDEWHRDLRESGWYGNFLNNHDHPRMLSRFPEAERYRGRLAKLLATFVLTLPGTPFLFQGEELGMTNPAFRDIDCYRDPNAHLQYEEALKGEADKAKKTEEAMEQIRFASRDNARTPMPWNDRPHAGFTDGAEPWMPVNPDYPACNVELEERDPDSILHYYRRLIRLRRQERCLRTGAYRTLSVQTASVFGYLRESDGDVLLVLLNFSPDAAALSLPKAAADLMADGSLVIGSMREDGGGLPGGELQLAPYESAVYRGAKPGQGKECGC